MLCLFHVISEVVAKLNYLQSSVAKVKKTKTKTRFPIFCFSTFGSVLKNPQHFRFRSSDNTEYLLVCFYWLLYLFLAAPFYMWDLGSLTKDQTCPLCIGNAES